MPAQLCPEAHKYNKGLCNFHTDIFLCSVLTQFPWSYVTRVLNFEYYKAERKSKAKPKFQWHSGFVWTFLLPPPSESSYFFTWRLLWTCTLSVHVFEFQPGSNWRVHVQLTLQLHSFMFVRMLDIREVDIHVYFWFEWKRGLMLMTFPTRVKMIRNETKVNTMLCLDLRICVT